MKEGRQMERLDLSIRWLEMRRGVDRRRASAGRRGRLDGLVEAPHERGTGGCGGMGWGGWVERGWTASQYAFQAQLAGLRQLAVAAWECAAFVPLMTNPPPARPMSSRHTGGGGQAVSGVLDDAGEAIWGGKGSDSLGEDRGVGGEGGEWT